MHHAHLWGTLTIRPCKCFLLQSCTTHHCDRQTQQRMQHSSPITQESKRLCTHITTAQSKAVPPHPTRLTCCPLNCVMANCACSAFSNSTTPQPCTQEPANSKPHTGRHSVSAIHLRLACTTHSLVNRIASKRNGQHLRTSTISSHAQIQQGLPMLATHCSETHRDRSASCMHPLAVTLRQASFWTATQLITRTRTHSRTFEVPFSLSFITPANSTAGARRARSEGETVC